MTIIIPHPHSKQEAKKRIEMLIQKYRNEYAAEIKNLKEQWTEYRNNIEVSAKGYTISANIEIQDGSISIIIKVPFLLLPFNKPIKSAIRDNVTKALI